MFSDVQQMDAELDDVHLFYDKRLGERMNELLQPALAQWIQEAITDFEFMALKEKAKEEASTELEQAKGLVKTHYKKEADCGKAALGVAVTEQRRERANEKLTLAQENVTRAQEELTQAHDDFKTADSEYDMAQTALTGAQTARDDARKAAYEALKAAKRFSLENPSIVEVYEDRGPLRYPPEVADGRSLDYPRRPRGRGSYRRPTPYPCPSYPRGPPPRYEDRGAPPPGYEDRN